MQIVSALSKLVKSPLPSISLKYKEKLIKLITIALVFYYNYFLSFHVTSRNNRQNIHRRSTVPRIPTEQAESSTESEEEDDRVLDGKVVSPPYGQQW